MISCTSMPIVVEVSRSFCNIRRFVGTHLRITSYCVKTSDYQQVLSEFADFQTSACNDDAEMSADETSPAQPRPPPASSPDIPVEILAPAPRDVSGHADFASSHGAPRPTLILRESCQ